MTIPVNIEQSTIGNSLAAALTTKGIVSDEPEPVPDHWLAAERAYIITGAGRSVSDWNKLRRLVQAKEISRFSFYRKVSAYCQSARDHPQLNDLEVAQITFAWGYFAALARMASVPSERY